MNSIEFFGSVDRKEGKPDGIVTSEYPAWMHDFKIDELKESHDRKERELAENRIPFEHVAAAKEELKLEKAKLALIEKSRPKLNDKQKDEFYGVYKDLTKEIRDKMYTRSEMMLGTANAHEEADRMITPSITIDPEIARMCNLQAVDGMVSRDGASKAFKMIGRILGEPTNVETLRRDNTTQRTGGRPKKNA